MLLLRRWRIILITVTTVIALTYLWQLAGFTPRLPFPQIYHLAVSAERVDSFPDDVLVPLNSTSSDSGVSIVFTARITGGIDNAPALTCSNITWDTGTDGLLSILGLCKPWWSGGKIPRLSKLGYVYEQPGTYTSTVSYGWLMSEPVTVEVP